MTYTAHCSNGITSHDVIVTVDKRLDHMPYAQAGIRNTIGGSQLISYETLVCEISFNWLRCYGTFSQSTRKHIAAYLKEKAPRLNYYDAKRSFENNVAINILTGEELPILKIEKEDSTMTTRQLVATIFCNEFMNDDFRYDLDLLNSKLIETYDKATTWHEAAARGENAFWIAWEMYILFIKHELVSRGNTGIDADEIRESAGSCFSTVYGDHHIAMQATANYINGHRNNAKKEEVSTMKDNRTISTSTNGTIDLDTIGIDVTCAKCGQIVATPEAGKIVEFEIVDGEVICEDCLDDETVVCVECGERILLDNAIEIDGEWYCKDCVDEYFVECYECGEYVRKDDATEVDGEWYCESCRDDECFFCERCNEWHIMEDATWIESEDRYVCSDCRDNYYFCCEHCDEWYRDRECNTVIVDENGNTEEWCDYCANRHAWTCEECGELYSADVDSGDDGDYICSECRGSRCQDTGDIRTWKSPECREGYHFKPVPCMCATDVEIAKAGIDWKQNIVFYGFELEIDRKQKCYEENEWSAKIVRKLPSCYCKTDCSLSKGGSYSGIEIVSHPATLAWYEERRDQFQDCFEMLREGGWLSHDAGTCGLHVHLSLHALEQRNDHAINNMLFLFDRFWDKLVKFSRRTNRQLDEWAKRYSTAHDEYERIKEMAKLDRDRYMAINLTNTHTVEIRMFRGTLNLESFFATLQLVDTIVERCIEIGNDYRRLQTITWEEFIASDHPELNSYLKRRGLVEGCEEQNVPEEEESADTNGTFRIGDRVRIDLQHNAFATVPEELSYGTVVGFDDSDRTCAVEFDAAELLEINYRVCMHSCDGQCTGMNGRWVQNNEMTRVSA